MSTLDMVAGAEVVRATETLPITPQTDEDKILAYAHEKYKTGEWRWIQWDYSRGESGKCLEQAILDAGNDLGFSSAFIARVKVRETTGYSSIPGWNDSPKRTFDDVLEVLESTIIGVSP